MNKKRITINRDLSKSEQDQNEVNIKCKCWYDEGMGIKGEAEMGKNQTHYLSYSLVIFKSSKLVHLMESKSASLS